jgi:hypothetical protein
MLLLASEPVSQTDWQIWLRPTSSGLRSDSVHWLTWFGRAEQAAILLIHSAYLDQDQLIVEKDGESKRN